MVGAEPVSASATAGRGRAFAGAQLTSTCTITRPSGESVWDETTGTYTDPAPIDVYSGPCRIRPAATQGRTAEAGEATALLSAFRVQLPFVVTGVDVGHRVTVDSSPDPALTGRTMVVRFVPDMGDHITARRLICEMA